MPSQRSARVLERKSIRNRPIRTATRGYIKRAQETIVAGDLEAASETTGRAVSILDKAASKGVIHKNNAARRKSRLMAKLNRLRLSQSEPTPRRRTRRTTTT